MRGRGRGRNWRSAPQPAPEPEPVQEEYQAENMNNQQPDLDFYQDGSDMANQEMEAPVLMEGQDAMASDSDGSLHEGEQQTRKRPWEKPGGREDGVKVKRKKVPGAKNLKIRRYVQPKNAVMCLNELRPGVSYITEQEGGVGQPFCISVEVPGVTDGQKYRGYGSSKQLAKQAAAEAALISFVKPPITTSETQEEDKTPWATLASFAIYKLFNDWREGRVGMCSPPSQPYGGSIPSDIKAFLNQSAGGVGGGGVGGGVGASTVTKEDSPQAAAFTEVICAHLGGRAPNTPSNDPKVNDPVKVPNPAKQVPESAAAMHPVMVLHQMKPGVQYNITQITKESKPFFTVSADIDGKEFFGEGPNVKKAKFFLAKAAIQGLYGVDSTFEATATN